jgi:hypothetical protein
MKRKITLLLTLALAGALLMLCYANQPRVPVQAAIPTPVGALVTGGEYTMVPYFGAKVMTESQASTSRLTARYSAADIQSVVDVGSSQTITCKLQWSNDDTNWTDGINVFADKTADFNDLVQTEMFGQRSRITCTLTTANPVTVTIRAKAWK